MWWGDQRCFQPKGDFSPRKNMIGESLNLAKEREVYNKFYTYCDPYIKINQIGQTVG
jgi:hypothetical protein